MFMYVHIFIEIVYRSVLCSIEVGIDGANKRLIGVIGKRTDVFTQRSRRVLQRLTSDVKFSFQFGICSLQFIQSGRISLQRTSVGFPVFVVLGNIVIRCFSGGVYSFGGWVSVFNALDVIYHPLPTIPLDVVIFDEPSVFRPHTFDSVGNGVVLFSVVNLRFVIGLKRFLRILRSAVFGLRRSHILL